MIATIQTKSGLTQANDLANSRYDWMPSVLAYRNEDLIERLEKKLKLSHDDASVLFNDLLRFLAMCGLRGDVYMATPLVPPKAIDEAWHHFLLFTEEYATFCEEYFGGFLHHKPSTSRTELRGSKIPETIALAKALFGETSKNWSKNWLYSDPADSGGADDCGGSTNCQVCYRD
jgi:hypothetical protein